MFWHSKYKMYVNYIYLCVCLCKKWWWYLKFCNIWGDVCSFNKKWHFWWTFFFATPCRALFINKGVFCINCYLERYTILIHLYQVLALPKEAHRRIRGETQVCYSMLQHWHTCMFLPGECIDGANSYTCACEVGWTGSQCDVALDPCTPNPCLNDGYCCRHGKAWCAANLPLAYFECYCTRNYAGEMRSVFYGLWMGGTCGVICCTTNRKV